MHSDYRRAGPDDRVIIRSQLGWFGNTGIGQLIAAGKLWVRIVKERPNLDVQAYQTCLARLAEDHLLRGSEIVFVVPITDVDFPDSPLFGLPDPSPPGLRLSDYRDAMRAAARTTGSATVDGPAVALAAKLDGATALLDEVHPSPAGHRVLADAIAEAIQGTR
jgi:lysophospholipase L1-like esterase